MSRALTGIVAFTIFLFCLVPSAKAAGELGLSWDGDSWSGQLSEPLFDPAVRWVPGDVGTKTFHVRNQAESGAILTIAVVTHDIDGLLRQEDIKLSARAGAADWVDLAGTDKNFRLNSDALPVGESRKVEVRALFDPASPNRSQRQQLTLTFRVTLSDEKASPEVPKAPGDVDEKPAGPGDSVDDDESSGLLPNAGAPPVGWFVVAAGVAIGAGLTLLKRREREETVHEPTP